MLLPIPTGAARRALTAIAVSVTVVLTASGCADFSEQDRNRDAGAFSSVPENQGPRQRPSAPSSPEEPQEPPKGPCVDPNPAVIATCLSTTSGVRPADPSGQTTYVAERTTGQIIISKRYGPQRVIATVPVESGGDGGLIDFELSPGYQQDRLIFALITTGSDNRVVRIAPDGVVTPVLTGIPKGPTGNMGSISFSSTGILRVATGNAGDAGAARDRGSLAGKLLEINTNADSPRPKILASGFGASVALCPDPENGRIYVADSGPAGDRLQMLEPSGLRRLWSWADRPGVTGCAVAGGQIAVSIAKKFRIDVLAAPSNASPSVGKPTKQDVKEQFGAVGRMTTFGAAMQLATINKSVPGASVQTDDRVAIYAPAGGTADDKR
ncbi:MAG: PQQ-dependent sugar dehydrogenase [Gordonia sp. (in: high G+C Gram-positive bacteria)]|uniref:PQQ-dependent sugar dehydrogenase n=1 Tax=Gordonia sp. (in: high G+C Gram-positive bacteria) TaxID=84139 RepID=UPI0039E309E9